jgi:serine/threonine protein kinase
MARLLYESKLNLADIYHIRWIPFNEFQNIKYLAKGGFGEVQKAEWIGNYYTDGNENKYAEIEVVLKRLYNSHDKILDILKEVNKKKV